MSLDELASKYISSAGRVFMKMTVRGDPISVNVESVRKVVGCAKDYLEDARYYMEKKKFEVSLTSVAYCEGLLDALRMLGAVSFEWPKKSAENEKRKVVLASGVFDLLHLEHVRFLEEAKKAGGPNAKLIVIVARDSTVERRKGKKPVMPEYQRCTLVASLKVVDEAMLGYEDFSMRKVLEKIRPDVVAVGHDSDVSGLEREVRDAIKKKGLDIKIVKISKFSSDELDSSSKIKQRIAEQFKG